MSNLRRIKRNLVPYRVQTGLALARMVAMAGSFGAVKEEFPRVFAETFGEDGKNVVYQGKNPVTNGSLPEGIL